MKKLFTSPLKKFNFCSILGISMLFLFINSCKKEEKSDSLFLSAKKWYTENNAKRTSLLKSNKNTSLDVTQDVQWEEANTTNLNDGTEILSVPVSMKLEGGSARGSYMLLISRHGKSFKSQIAYNEKDNYFETGLSTDEIEQLYNSLNKITINRKLMTDEGGGGMSDEPQCTFWYLVETFWYSDGTVAYTTETYLYKTCSSTNGDGSGNGNGTGVVDCAGVVNGTAYRTTDCKTCMGGTTGITECPKDIRNKTTDTCISTVVNALVGANKNIEGKISEIIKNFDQNKDLNINIYDGVTANGKPGNMFHWALIGSEFTADVRLQTSYFKGQDGASKESLAAVLIHEVLHSYITSQNPSLLDTNNVHHNTMVQNYIEPMSNYLTSAFGILRKDAFSLAWNGVIDSDVFSKADTDKLFSYTYTENGTNHTISISKQEIMNRAGAYNGNTNYADEGKKGTKTCPN